MWWGVAGQVAQAVVQDTTGQVSEAWTGPQVAWKMARGGEGSFGGKTLLKPYVWLAFCLVFLIGLADLRRPLSVRNLDLLVLLGFTVSLAFFDRGEIFRSVPAVYPVLAYLLARGLWVGFRGRSAAAVVRLADLDARCRCRLPARFPRRSQPRDSTGSHRRRARGSRRAPTGSSTARRPYGNMPQRGDLKPCGPEDAEGQVRERIQTNGRCEAAIERGDTYGPVSYLAYVPAVAVFDWSGKWDSLPAAHATSIAFDVLAVLGLLLIGVRFAGPRLGVLLAFGWVAYPFTAYTLNANTNDAIMPVFLLARLLAGHLGLGARRIGRTRGLDEVRRAPRRAALGHVPRGSTFDGCSASRSGSPSRRCWRSRFSCSSPRSGTRSAPSGTARSDSSRAATLRSRSGGGVSTTRRASPTSASSSPSSRSPPSRSRRCSRSSRVERDPFSWRR